MRAQFLLCPMKHNSVNVDIIFQSDTFKMPLQLSPVAIRNNVNMLLPRSLKFACLPKPAHGVAAEHSRKIIRIS